MAYFRQIPSGGFLVETGTRQAGIAGVGFAVETVSSGGSTNYDLTAIGVATGAPVIGTATLSINYDLTAIGVATGAPIIGTATLSIDSGSTNYDLTAYGVATGAPIIGTAALSINYALTAYGVATGAPIIGTATLTTGSSSLTYNAGTGKIELVGAHTETTLRAYLASNPTHGTYDDGRITLLKTLIATGAGNSLTINDGSILEFVGGDIRPEFNTGAGLNFTKGGMLKYVDYKDYAATYMAGAVLTWTDVVYDVGAGIDGRIDFFRQDISSSSVLTNCTFVARACSFGGYSPIFTHLEELSTSLQGRTRFINYKNSSTFYMQFGGGKTYTGIELPAPSAGSTLSIYPNRDAAGANYLVDFVIPSTSLALTEDSYSNGRTYLRDATYPDSNSLAFTWSWAGLYLTNTYVLYLQSSITPTSLYDAGHTTRLFVQTAAHTVITNAVVADATTKTWYTYRSIGGTAVSPAGERGVVDYGPFDIIATRYGYKPIAFTNELSDPYVFGTSFVADLGITQTNPATVAAYTGFSSETSTTATITTAKTASEVYDRRQYVESINPAYIHAGGALESYASSASGSQYDYSSDYVLTLQAALSGKKMTGLKLVLGTGWALTAPIEDATLSFPTAGTYDLRSASLSGTITLVNTSGGAVLVKLPLGTTYVNSGPSITVEVSREYVVTAANIPAGASVRLFNDTQATELDMEVGLGSGGYSTTITLKTGGTIEVGDTLRLDAFKASGTTYSTYYTASTIVSALGDWTIIDPWETWAEATALGVDGSTVTDFQTDYSNVQVDINDTSAAGFWVKDLIAFILYKTMEADGMRTFFGALTAQNSARWIVDATAVDLMADNITAYMVDQTDEVVITRSDGVYLGMNPTTSGYPVRFSLANDISTVLPTAASFAGAVWEHTATTAVGTKGDDLKKAKTAAQTAVALSA